MTTVWSRAERLVEELHFLCMGCEAEEIGPLEILDSLACAGLTLTEDDGKMDASVAYITALTAHAEASP
jgi:hypothetical protein